MDKLLVILRLGGGQGPLGYHNYRKHDKIQTHTLPLSTRIRHWTGHWWGPKREAGKAFFCGTFYLIFWFLVSSFSYSTVTFKIISNSKFVTTDQILIYIPITVDRTQDDNRDNSHQIEMKHAEKKHFHWMEIDFWFPHFPKKNFLHGTDQGQHCGVCFEFPGGGSSPI